MIKIKLLELIREDIIWWKFVVWNLSFDIMLICDDFYLIIIER